MHIADLLYESSDFDAAEVELRRVAFAQSRTLGRHNTLVSKSKVAATILMQGKIAAARDQLLDLVPRMESLGGVDEPSLLARANLAHAHRTLGDSGAAIRELRETLSLCGNGEYKEPELVVRTMLRELTGEN